MAANVAFGVLGQLELRSLTLAPSHASEASLSYHACREEREGTRGALALRGQCMSVIFATVAFGFVGTFLAALGTYVVGLAGAPGAVYTL